MSETKERTIPKLEHKLSGQQNFAAWILSIEMCLSMYDVGKTDYTIWDIVTGKYGCPSGETGESTSKQLEKLQAAKAAWNKANFFALLAMRKNCEEEPLSRFELSREAHEAYKALKSHYEGKTVTDIGIVLANVIRLTYDDRQHTIDEHISEYERKWGFMRSTLSSGEFPDYLKTFGQHLKGISESDAAKAEFLLLSLPPYYNTLVENLRTKEKYTYGDIVRSLKLYVPGRQKNKRKEGKEAGTAENPIVLKTDTKKKECRYCKEEKGWRGIGHTEDECFTKKRDLERKKKEAKKAELNDDSDSDTFVHSVRVQNLSRTEEEKGWYEYDTGAAVHTTNELHRLINIQDVSITVKGHDGARSVCRKIGDIEFRHKGRRIRLKDVMYHQNFSNLISGQKFKNHEIKATEKTAVIWVEGKKVYEAERIDGKIWVVPDYTNSDVKAVNRESIKELHERYGHMSFNLIASLPEAQGLPKNSQPYCEACEQAKSQKPAARNYGKIRTSEILERIHADIVDPLTKLVLMPSLKDWMKNVGIMTRECSK